MKLVRDLIPTIIEESGKQCEYHIADTDEHRLGLYTKMGEEMAEFIENPSIEEAADIYEVLRGICLAHDLRMLDVIRAAERKKIERGGFTARIILDDVK